MRSFSGLYVNLVNPVMLSKLPLHPSIRSVSFSTMLRAGIVGLPNVGKSTLFNALTAQSAALAANYPFATIEPNVGVVLVPDERLEPLARLVKTEKIVPATVEFLDIAGLVRGASQGGGLGGEVLGNIRETDKIGRASCRER